MKQTTAMMTAPMTANVMPIDILVRNIPPTKVIAMIVKKRRMALLSRAVSLDITDRVYPMVWMAVDQIAFSAFLTYRGQLVWMAVDQIAFSVFLTWRCQYPSECTECPEHWRVRRGNL